MVKDILKKGPKIIKRPLYKIYENIPVYYRYNKLFRKTYEFLADSEFWDKKEMEEYQLIKLKELLKHAYNTVPYYRRLFDENNIKIEEIRKISDIKKIPYLTKEIIKANRDELISTAYDKNKLEYVTTGGSTGTPMGFYRDKNYDEMRELAFITNMWKRIGYNIKKNNKTVILRGNIPANGDYEYKGNSLILSSFKIEDNIEKYISLIESYKADFIQAYPSTIIILANYILQNKIKIELNELKAIICGSENLNSKQKKCIEEAFKCKVYIFYGHTEHSCIGGGCEKSDEYHLNNEYGYTELIDQNGDDVTIEGNVGELVVTGFNNFAFPFIRYRTDDMASLGKNECECGRNSKLVKKIEGRKQEYFINKDNKKVIFTWADYPLWQCKDLIWAYQYIQDEIGKVKLNIWFKNKNTQYNLEKIEKVFKEYYTDIDVEIIRVDFIKRTGRGKFRYLIQNINI